MRPALRQRGQLLVAGVVLIVVVALMVVALGFLYVSSERSSTLHGQSGTAYAAAYSGIEVTKYQFSTGTACGSFTTTSQQVGSGQFSTDVGRLYPTAFTATLTSNIPAGSVSSVPLTFTSGSLSNLAPHGEITIGTESIDYGGTSLTGSACSPAPCLGGIVRGANGTTAAAHTAGNAVTQASQCLITSTGTAGGATRKLESTVQASASGVSNSFTGVSRTLTTIPATTSLTPGGWTPSLPAGDNYVFAIVTFSNIGGHTTIPLGNLKLVATFPGATLQSTTALVDVGGSATASPNNFPQETQFLMGKHTGATTAATYDVTVDSPSNANTVARVQILAISGIASANASLTPGVLTPILTSTTPLVTSGAITAGNNIVIAQVQLDNPSGAKRDINPLAINKSGTPIMSNTYSITLDKQGNVNQGTGALLMVIDPNAVAGQTYTVSALASGANTKGSASILVFNGFNAAVNSPSSNPIGTTSSPLDSVNTTFSAGENVVLASIQYENPLTTGNLGQRNIVVSPPSPSAGENLRFNTTSVVSNAYNWNLCAASGGGNAATECNDFYSGLLWRQAAMSASPTFDVQATADNTGMTGAVNILAISLTGGVRRINTLEIYP